MRRRKRKVSRRRANARGFYDSYMSSPAWWRFRREWFEWAKVRGQVLCVGCSKKWALSDDLHHITYARLSTEAFSDVWPLCRDCHAYVHSVIDRPAWKRAGRIQAHRAALGGLRAHYQTEPK